MNIPVLSGLRGTNGRAGAVAPSMNLSIQAGVIAQTNQIGKSPASLSIHLSSHRSSQDKGPINRK